MFLPSFEDVMEIHEELVDLFKDDEDPIQPPGARDFNLVHSACMRPTTGMGDHEKYESDYDKAAALFHSLTQNHAFHNGNKRTALVTLLATLYRNGRILKFGVSDEEIYELTVAVANGSYLNAQERIDPDRAVDLISGWIRSNTVARHIAPSDMKVGEFLDRCTLIGCTIREYQGGHLISFSSNSIRIGGDTRQISGKVAKRYLGMLGLTYEQTGQTFAEFQNVDDPEERKEIYKYMGVLRRLAKI